MLDAVMEGAALSAPARRMLFAGSDNAEPSNYECGEKSAYERIALAVLESVDLTPVP